MEKTIGIIATMLGCIMTAINLIIVLSKPFRSIYRSAKLKREEEERSRQEEKAEKNVERLKEIERIETEKCLLRDRITAIYFANKNEDAPSESKIRMFDLENASLLYVQYKKLGGNSFIDTIWDEMQSWNII